MYRRGQGVAVDDGQAATWYGMAAAQGSALAQSILGVMYANGMGVAGSYVQAHLWFNLAARRGNAAAAKNLEIIAGRMTSQQIDAALGLAAEWQSK